MAGQLAGWSRVAGPTRWLIGSPRLTQFVAVQVAVLLAGGLAATAALRAHASVPPGPWSLAAAVEPPAVSPHPLEAVASRGRTRARAHPKQSRPKAAPKSWSHYAPRIRFCESTDNYQARNPTSSASGAYQILDATWEGRFGVQHAADATPAQQDQVAADLYRRWGTRIWAASAPCWR